MNFLKKLFGICDKQDYIGLSEFSNNSATYDDLKPVKKDGAKKEMTLSDMLRRTSEV